MSRRANASIRCALCRMHQTLCVCALMPRIETKTRLSVVMHRLEARKTTNTGRIAAACLPNSEVLVRGHIGRPEPEIGLAPGSRAVVLFPFEDAVPIETFAGGPPVTLVVPDGTWRQASKVKNRLPALRDVPCVSLPRGDKTQYRLRIESHEDGLATMEAIARAMGVLEGKHVEDALLFVFRAMVDRTLWSRGDLATERVTGGIPAGVERHDPAGFEHHKKIAGGIA
jgi:DTW domain-containing protein YfiP